MTFIFMLSVCNLLATTVLCSALFGICSIIQSGWCCLMIFLAHVMIVAVISTTLAILAKVEVMTVWQG